MEITILVSALIGCGVVSFVIWTLFTTGAKSYDQAIAEQQQRQRQPAPNSNKGTSKKNRPNKYNKNKKKSESGDDESTVNPASFEQQQSTSSGKSNESSRHVVQANNRNDRNSNDIKSKTTDSAPVTDDKQKPHSVNKSKDIIAKQNQSARKPGKTASSNASTSKNETKKTTVNLENNSVTTATKAKQVSTTESKQTKENETIDGNQPQKTNILDDKKTSNEIRNKRSLPTEQKSVQSNKRKKTARQSDGTTVGDITKKLNSSTFTEEEIQILIDHLLEKQVDGTWQKSSVKETGIVNLRKQLQVKEAELTQEKESNRNFLKQIKDTRNQLSEERVKRDSLYNKANNKITSQTKEITELKEQLHTLRQNTPKKAFVEQGFNDLEQLRTTNMQLNESLKTSKQQLNDTLQDMTKKDNTIRRYQDKINSFERQLEKYKASNTEKPDNSESETIEYITAFKNELVQSTSEQHADKLVPLTKSLVAKTKDEEKVIKCLYEIAEAVTTSIGKYRAISKSSTNVIGRCEIIRSDIKNHKSNVITITKTVEGLLSKLDIFDKDRDNSMEEMKDEIKRSNICIQDLERKQNELQHKCKQLQNVVTEKENEIKNLQITQNVHATENNKSDSTGKDDLIKKQKAELGEANKKLKESSLNIENLNQEKDRITQKNNVLLQQEKAAKEAYAKLQSDINNKNQTIKSLEEAITQKNNSMNEQLQVAQKSTAEKDRKIKALESEVKAKEKAYSQVSESMKSNNNSQVKELDEKLQKVHTVAKAHLKNSFPQVKEDASLDITDWMVHFGSGIKTFCDTVTSKAVEVENKLRAEVDNVQKLLKSSSDNEAKLKDQLSKVSKERNDEAQQKTVNAKSNETTVKILTMELQTLKDGIKGEKDKSRRYEVNVKELNNKLDDSIKELKKERTRNDDLSTNSKKLEKAVEESQVKTAKFREELKQLQAELAKTGNEANKYNQDLIAERMAASQLKEKLTKLEMTNNDFQNVRKELDEVKSKLSFTDTKLIQKSKALSARDDAYRSLEVERNKLSSDLAKTKQELAEKIANAQQAGSTKIPVKSSKTPSKSPSKSPIKTPIKSPAKDDTAV